ncbi:MAG: glycosyltransferase, partial [Rhodospirillaceae bacterium]|nr:glycosyltransferase [Rhodospirillaceae bacterium]
FDPGHAIQSILQNKTLLLKDRDATVWQSQAEVAKGLAFIDRGEFSAAVEPLLVALEINSWNVAAYYYLGAAFANSGELEKANFIFAKAINQFPYVFGRSSRFGEFQGFAIDVKTVIAYYDALSEPIDDLKILLGQDSKPLITEADLLQKYSNALKEWREQKTPEPILSNSFQAKPVRRDQKVLLVTPQYIKCSPDWDEYEISFYLVGTGAAVLTNFEIHHSDKFHTEGHQLAEPRSDQTLASGIAALRDQIDRQRPDIVLFEGNFMGGLQSMPRDELLALKREFGFKLATLVIDINPPLENYAAYWAEVSDLVVAMNENPYLDAARNFCPVMVYPGIPIDLALYQSAAATTRDIDAIFIGARKRYRDMWCAYMKDAGIELTMKFTEQSLANSIRFDEYFDLHLRSKIVFNNGLVSSSDHALNLRIFETIAAKAVLLQQDFDQLQDYFVPYIHYAPFTNVPEMIATAKFLLTHPAIAEAITEEAFAWYEKCYGGERFWHTLLVELAP